jgi:hypothetical protein
VFILEYYFASKLFAAVREAFSNVYPDTGNNITDTVSVACQKCPSCALAATAGFGCKVPYCR